MESDRVKKRDRGGKRQTRSQADRQADRSTDRLTSRRDKRELEKERSEISLSQREQKVSPNGYEIETDSPENCPLLIRAAGGGDKTTDFCTPST